MLRFPRLSRRLALATGLLASLALTAPASASSDQDFVLVNQTGAEIDQVFVSRSDQSVWGRDVLGRDVLPNGNNTQILFPAGTQGCAWDLRVVYSDKSAAQWAKLNLCSISKVTLFHNRQTGATRATLE